jgi:hypothetical protein
VPPVITVRTPSGSSVCKAAGKEAVSMLSAILVDQSLCSFAQRMCACRQNECELLLTALFAVLQRCTYSIAMSCYCVISGRAIVPVRVETFKRVQKQLCLHNRSCCVLFHLCWVPAR